MFRLRTHVGAGNLVVNLLLSSILIRKSRFLMRIEVKRRFVSGFPTTTLLRKPRLPLWGEALDFSSYETNTQTRRTHKRDEHTNETNKPTNGACLHTFSTFGEPLAKAHQGCRMGGGEKEGEESSVDVSPKTIDESYRGLGSATQGLWIKNLSNFTQRNNHHPNPAAPNIHAVLFVS